MTTRSIPREITLAGQAFAVPPLPLRVNREVYPLCRKLVQAGLIDRCIAGGGSLDCSQEEFDDLTTIAFLSAQTARPGLTREEFDALAVTPPELLDALFTIRYQTGAWLPAQAPAGDDASPGEPAPGEGAGRRRPRK